MDDFVARIQAKRVDSKYSLVRKIGQGGFGAVYLGQDFDTGEQVALKLEHRNRQPSMLREEADQYDDFKGLVGFPDLYWYGEFEDFRIMAFELLGPSLEDLFVYCGNRFSLKTGLMVMDQLLCRFQALHSRGFLHRDVKPENCLMGLGERGSTVYLTDFGLVWEYSVGDSKPVLRPNRQPQLIGTTRFASVQGHLGISQSPRDDLESLGYMIVYFIKGRLPWQGLKADTGEQKDLLVLDKKRSIDEEDLCSGLPREFVEYMRYLKLLPWGEEPDHAKLRQLFHKAAQRNGLEYDDIFDWTVLMYLQEKHGNAG